MNTETKIKCAAVCSVCLLGLILCGCSPEQSHHKREYAFSTQQITGTANGLREIDGKSTQAQSELYSPMLYEALNYVDKHSTEWMKQRISRGELTVGMNQKEVIACLYATDFKDGIPVTSKKLNSKYGKYESWLIRGSTEGNYFYSPPRYTLDFTDCILKCMHEPKDFQINHRVHTFAQAP